ncbi:MAG: SCO1664 family protein [Roseiflexaceae bacterium]|nr:SCO1664 family protein [Roseiflexaceae bacterium]
MTELNVASILSLLAQGEIEVQGMLPYSSNYTLLTLVRQGDLQGLAVYKPRRGERPLWDFPRGTLCQREVAAYVLNEALGWQLVPPTVLRDGPYGVGSMQLFIDSDEQAHLFTMQKEGGYEDQIERLAAFDVLANNADRKSGHCLKGSDNRLWAIDHGICFHSEYKLRTVLWDYAGKPLRPDILADLTALRDAWCAGESTYDLLDQLLAEDEMRAMRRRLDKLVGSGRHHAEPGQGRNIPWPPV